MQLIFNQLPFFDDHYNEMVDIAGNTRAHWLAMIDLLSMEEPIKMRQRVETVRRQVRDNGVTYNVYADTHGLQRPWDLDVLPFILPHEEWSAIADAVAQRATLLNKILIDIYDTQSILNSGKLPAALVHGHAGFLRPSHGVQHLDGIALHNYAVDIARAPNGKWWVVSDRTQAPTGAGYALENRTIISSVFPDLFRDLNIQRLSGFFSNMRDSLSYWGRICAQKQHQSIPEIALLSEGEQPLIVILTPGPYNETYHEQSYLAGYLGFPLVQGSDLTVRNNVAWLKTISGLKPVHVILRRLDDDFCDPLAFNPDSLLGVAGLNAVAKAGHVLVANALGANLLQSGALLGFLPNLCQQLLGESLLMPSVATWWCGEPKALETVIDNLQHLVIKPAFPQIQEFPIFVEDLNVEEKNALIAKLRANPNNYIAQEQVKLSQAPVWNKDKQTLLGTAAVGLRVYACATPNGYVIMPGGLARVAGTKDERIINMQRGGVSKDTWITALHMTPSVSLLRRTTSSKDLVRGNTYLSSRMVENLFWFGRYLMRNTHQARLLRTAIRFLLEFTNEQRAIEWPTINSLCVIYGFLPSQNQLKEAKKLNPDDKETSIDLTDEEIEALLINAVFFNKNQSFASGIEQIFQLAFNLRERLSTDNWRIINQMSQRLKQVSAHPNLSDTLTQLDEANGALVTLTGFTLDGMTRDQGWRFMSIGRRIERLQFLCTLLQQALLMPVESNLECLLSLTDSIVTYRARYSAQPEWLPVLDLILMDENNPNSMIFQLKGLVKYLTEISNNDNGERHERGLSERLVSLTELNPDLALYHGSNQLLNWLSETFQVSVKTSDALSLRFFSVTRVPHFTL